MVHRNDGLIEPDKVWRRIHRPEYYAPDAAKFLAKEIGIPFIIVKPFIPLARSVLCRWEDAAVETTALYLLPDGDRVLQTFFKITDYSNAAVYAMLEKILKRLGIGARLSEQYGDMDFAWVLLGGVLEEYATSAGVCRRTTRRLNDFRYPLSDYFTATTWYPDRVEITNLDTGAVNSLDIPSRDIRKIIDWSVKFEESICRTDILEPGTAYFDEYLRLTDIYDSIHSRAVVENVST